MSRHASLADAGAVPRVGARAFLGLDRVDVRWLLALVVSAFLLRAGGPIFPDVLSHPTSGAPVTAWGLGFPYNGGECTGDAIPVGPQGQVLSGDEPGQKHCGFVFDELYFPVDALFDLHSPPREYFDPEPPLTKLLMAPPIALLGFGGWSWRLTVAIAGSLLVGLVYLIARRLRPRDRFFAVAAALIINLDGLEFVESRIGVIDIIAIFFAALVFYVFLLHWGARTRGQWRATVYGLGAITGLAFGAKLTAIAPLVVAAALIAVRLLEPRLRTWLPALKRLGGETSGEARMWRDAAGPHALLHYGGAAVLAVALFAGCYARYLTIDHPIRTFTTCALPNDLRADDPVTYRAPALVHIGPIALPTPTTLRTAATDITAQVRGSLNYHSTECRDHPFASRWYTWPAVAHPVLMYADYGSFKTAGGQPEVGYITDLGSPAVWWLAVPALLFCAWRMTTGPPRWRLFVLGVLGLSLLALTVGFHSAETDPDVTITVHPGVLFYLGVAGALLSAVLIVLCATAGRRFVPAVIVLGYLAAWLMWMMGNEKRVLFYYHMLGALPFMALGLAYALTALRATRVRLGDTFAVSLRPLAWAGLGLVVASFVFFYPWWSGAPQESADHAMRMWFESWVDAWK